MRGLSFALSSILIGRAFSPRAIVATGFFALAGFLAGASALTASRLLAKKPLSARFAAALICLLAGTAALASVFFMLQLVLSHHRLSEIPIRISLIILAVSGAGALYNVLAIAAPVIMPLGLPLIALFAWLIAKSPR